MGSIVSVVIKESKLPNNYGNNNLNSSGGRLNNKFAFVEFEDVESVLFSVEMLDNLELFGKRIVVAPRDNTQQVYFCRIFSLVLKSLKLNKNTVC